MLGQLSSHMKKLVTRHQVREGMKMRNMIAPAPMIATKHLTLILPQIRFALIVRPSFRISRLTDCHDSLILQHGIATIKRNITVCYILMRLPRREAICH